MFFFYRSLFYHCNLMGTSGHSVVLCQYCGYRHQQLKQLSRFRLQIPFSETKSFQYISFLIFTHFMLVLFLFSTACEPVEIRSWEGKWLYLPSICSTSSDNGFGISLPCFHWLNSLVAIATLLPFSFSITIDICFSVETKIYAGLNLTSPVYFDLTQMALCIMKAVSAPVPLQHPSCKQL